MSHLFFNFIILYLFFCLDGIGISEPFYLSTFHLYIFICLSFYLDGIEEGGGFKLDIKLHTDEELKSDDEYYDDMQKDLSDSGKNKLIIVTQF